MLRQFLYLDESLVKEFLAQAEGGLYDERKQSAETTRGAKAGGKLGIGSVGAEVGGSAQGLERSERTVVQTGPSEFERLHAYLDDQRSVISVSDVDDKHWERLRRGSFLEIEADVRLSGMTTMAQLAEAASGFMAFAEAFGQPMEQEAKNNVQLVKALATVTENLPVAVHVVADTRFKFRAKLQSQWLRVAVEDIAGEAIVLGKLGRKLVPGQTLALDEILPGMEFVKPTDRRKLERQLRSTEVPGVRIGDMSLSFPAADLVPLAIFR
jgi:hypothetical protein